MAISTIAAPSLLIITPAWLLDATMERKGKRATLMTCGATSRASIASVGLRMVHRLVLGGTPIVRGKRAMDEPPAEADSVRLRGVESKKKVMWDKRSVSGGLVVGSSRIM